MNSECLRNSWVVSEGAQTRTGNRGECLADGNFWVDFWVVLKQGLLSSQSDSFEKLQQHKWKSPKKGTELFNTAGNALDGKNFGQLTCSKIPDIMDSSEWRSKSNQGQRASFSNSSVSNSPWSPSTNAMPKCYQMEKVNTACGHPVPLSIRVFETRTQLLWRKNPMSQPNQEGSS